MIYQRPYPPIDGWMVLPEIQWLYHQAKKYKTIVEIGSWKGKSTHALLSGAVRGGGQVVAVDHFQGAEGFRDTYFGEAQLVDIYHVFMSRVGHFPNLTVYKMSSAEAAPHLPEVEMVFIDGGHEPDEVESDLDLWVPKATKLICGHDYTNFDGVKKAVNKRFGLPDGTIETVWWVDLEKRAQGAVTSEPEITVWEAANDPA